MAILQLIARDLTRTNAITVAPKIKADRLVATGMSSDAADCGSI
jgi:hypothetical protein